MIETLLTNKTFIVIGSFVSIITIFSIFKKLLKVTVLSICLLVLFGIYAVKTGKNTDDIIELKNDAKKVLNNIDDIVPEDARNTFKSISKKLENTSKSVGKKELQETTKKLRKKIKKVAPKDINFSYQATLDPVNKDRLKKR